MEYFSSSLDLDQISCTYGLLRDVKRQIVKLITHLHTWQGFRIRGAIPPVKHTFVRRVAEAEATFSFEKKNLNIVANFNDDFKANYCGQQLLYGVCSNKTTSCVQRYRRVRMCWKNHVLNILVKSCN